MIRIQGLSEPRKTAAAKKTAATGRASFAPHSGGVAATTASAQPSAANQTEMLSALIALQGDGRGRAKTIAAAQRTLDLLDGLRMRLLDGQAGEGDLAALEAAARVRAHADAPPELLELYDQISLRARVELAKRGR